MRTALLLAAVLGLLLGLLLGGGCRTATEIRDPRAGAEDAKPTFHDLTSRPEGEEGKPVDPAKCKHVFQQVGVHTYKKMQNGMEMPGLCVITRCARCGEVRHECNPDYRGRIP